LPIWIEGEVNGRKLSATLGETVILRDTENKLRFKETQLTTPHLKCERFVYVVSLSLLTDLAALSLNCDNSFQKTKAWNLLI
jgi:hypothetical protein